MKTEGVIEIVAFKSKPGQSERVKELTKKAVREVREHGGLLDEVLLQSRDDPNLFVHHLRWTSLDQARKVAALFPTFACAKDFAEATSEPLVMGHFAAALE